MNQAHISAGDLEILRTAKAANQWWFQAIIFCAKIMLPRRSKYSGNKHPYFNFFDVAQKQGDSVFNIFCFYNNIKLSRKDAGVEDFSDEGFKDTLADLANYALLFLGFLLGKLRQEDVDNYQEPDWNEAPYDWPTICIDFDGVFNLFDGWKGHYAHFDSREGIHSFLETLTLDGFSIVIFTARPDITDTWSWLYDHGLGRFVSDVTNVKPPAICYVDDRAVLFDGNFDKALETVRNFKTHWEK